MTLQKKLRNRFWQASRQRQEFLKEAAERDRWARFWGQEDRRGIQQSEKARQARQEARRAMEQAVRDAEQAIADYRQEMEEASRPRGEDIHPDAKLFEVPGLLSAGDYQALLERHADNATMTRLISGAAKRDGINVAAVNNDNLADDLLGSLYYVQTWIHDDDLEQKLDRVWGPAEGEEE